MEEMWKELEGFEGKYKVSNLGEVYSYHNEECIGNAHGRVIIKGKSYNKGYLVAKMFIPNPNNFTKIIHKDENNTNNKVENLEWVDDATYKAKTQKYIMYSKHTIVVCQETGEEIQSSLLAHKLYVPEKMVIYACMTGKKLGGNHYIEKRCL